MGTMGYVMRRAMQVNPEDRADPAMSLLPEQLVSLALLLRLGSLALLLLPSVVLLLPVRLASLQPPPRGSGDAAQGRAFTTPINRGRKRHGDDDDEGVMSASNIMGMMMMQQRSEQSSRDTDRTVREEAELALCREEITMRHEEMAMQMQMQREESRAHQQMMNVMLMTMMQNSGGSNHQQQRMDIGESNQHQRTDSGTNEQQNNCNNE